MAFEYSIDTDRRVALLTFSGLVTGAEFAQATQAIYADKAWQYGFDSIWDLTRVNKSEVEWDEYKRLADSAKEYADIAGPGRDVMVVARKIDEAMGRIHVQWTKKTSVRQSRVCRSMVQAWAILAEGDNKAGK